jgi:translocator protein
MAIAAWLVWRTPKTGLRATSRLSGLNLFSIQLLLNAVWTPVFFHYHQLLAALIVILCLTVAILLTTARFWKVDRFAAALLLPYLAWVGFATALNYQIYRLN